MKRSLKEFTKSCWPTIEPASKFVDNWHIDAISEHLQAVVEGNIKRLIINIPPRHMKSISVAVALPAWTWTLQPSKNSCLHLMRHHFLLETRLNVGGL